MAFSGDYDGSILEVLEQMRLTADLEGAAVLDLSPDAMDAPVAYSLGSAGVDTIDQGRRLLTEGPARPSHMRASDGRPVLACPWVLLPARPGGLVLWREPRARAWVDEDHDLAAAVAMLLRIAIGASMGQIGIDRLTNLPNRRWFLDEGDRHIERLDQDGTMGTLFLVDIDDLRRVNLELGRAQGDRILVRMASELRALVRPGDLVARIGADEFAIWQNGMDHLTAAERAETLCARRLFQDLPPGQAVTFSIGIASRGAGSSDDIRALLRRAHMAAREIKGKGGGGWRVAHAAQKPRLSNRPA